MPQLLKVTLTTYEAPAQQNNKQHALPAIRFDLPVADKNREEILQK
jgi:hypothetical protein